MRHLKDAANHHQMHLRDDSRMILIYRYLRKQLSKQRPANWKFKSLALRCEGENLESMLKVLNLTAGRKWISKQEIARNAFRIIMLAKDSSLLFLILWEEAEVDENSSSKWNFHSNVSVRQLFCPAPSPLATLFFGENVRNQKMIQMTGIKQRAGEALSAWRKAAKTIIIYIPNEFELDW